MPLIKYQALSAAEDEEEGLAHPPPPPIPISGSEESLSYEYETYSHQGSTFNPFDEELDLELDIGNPFTEETDIDSGVMVDVLEQSPYLVKKLVKKIEPPKKKGEMQGNKKIDPAKIKEKLATSKIKEKKKDDKMRKEFAELEVAMSHEKESRRAKCLLYCLKTYCIIFVLFVICLGLYMAADAARGGDLEQRAGDGNVKQSWLQSGYKELRLGARRVYYRVCEADGMANHTVLLVHGNSGTGEMFSKLGTMQFLRDHGARAVAIDVIGFGKSDPPMHILDSYEDFFTEIVDLFELEYNLILVCVEEGCDKLLPYYLNHGVYKTDNSFIEGAVFISPRGDSYSKYVQPEKQRIPTASRTLIVNGAKDEFLNLDVSNSLAMVPRSEIHPLPDLKNNFYRTSNSKSYFHAALQAFIEGLEYAYDRELQEIADGPAEEPAENNGYQSNYDNNNNNNNNIYDNTGQSSSGGGYAQSSSGGGRGGYNNNNPQNAGYNQNNAAQSPVQQGYRGGGYNNRQPAEGGDAFSRFNAKQNSGFKDMSYNPANRFSGIKQGKRGK